MRKVSEFYETGREMDDISSLRPNQVIAHDLPFFHNIWLHSTCDFSASEKIQQVAFFFLQVAKIKSIRQLQILHELLDHEGRFSLLQLAARVDSKLTTLQKRLAMSTFPWESFAWNEEKVTIAADCLATLLAYHGDKHENVRITAAYAISQLPWNLYPKYCGQSIFSVLKTLNQLSANEEVWKYANWVLLFNDIALPYDFFKRINMQSHDTDIIREALCDYIYRPLSYKVDSVEKLERVFDTLNSVLDKFNHAGVYGAVAFVLRDVLLSVNANFSDQLITGALPLLDRLIFNAYELVQNIDELRKLIINAVKVLFELKDIGSKQILHVLILLNKLTEIEKISAVDDSECVIFSLPWKKIYITCVKSNDITFENFRNLFFHSKSHEYVRKEMIHVMNELAGEDNLLSDGELRDVLEWLLTIVRISKESYIVIDAAACALRTFPFSKTLQTPADIASFEERIILLEMEDNQYSVKIIAFVCGIKWFLENHPCESLTKIFALLQRIYWHISSQVYCSIREDQYKYFSTAIAALGWQHLLNTQIIQALNVFRVIAMNSENAKIFPFWGGHHTRKCDHLINGVFESIKKLGETDLQSENWDTVLEWLHHQVTTDSQINMNERFFNFVTHLIEELPLPKLNSEQRKKIERIVEIALEVFSSYKEMRSSHLSFMYLNEIKTRVRTINSATVVQYQSDSHVSSNAVESASSNDNVSENTQHKILPLLKSYFEAVSSDNVENGAVYHPALPFIPVTLFTTKDDAKKLTLISKTRALNMALQKLLLCENQDNDSVSVNVREGFKQLILEASKKALGISFLVGNTKTEYDCNTTSMRNLISYFASQQADVLKFFLCSKSFEDISQNFEEYVNRQLRASTTSFVEELTCR